MEIGGQTGCCFPLYVDSSISRDLSLHITVFTQFAGLLKGEVREEIWSSVPYLFFVSTYLIYGKIQQVRQGIV